MSQAAITSAQDQASPVAWLYLVTVRAGVDVLRFVNNTESVTSRGQTFTPFPFSLVLPADDGEKVPQVSLRLQNFDDAIMKIIRGSASGAIVDIELTTTIDTNVVELSLTGLVVREVSYDAIEVNCTLMVPQILSRSFGGTYSPQRFPGLFA